MLYEHNGVLGIMKTYREGDRVKLVKNMLGDFDALIVKLDPRKGRAQLQYDFDGSSYKVWVGYDMIDDVDGKADGE
jgi:transcription antitermination factor NusG